MSCYRCGRPHEPEDNYCRRCGAALRSRRLPVPREPYALAPWRGWGPPAVRGAAVLAAGSLLPWLLRRLARRALTPRLPALRDPKARALAPKEADSRPQPTQEATVGEFIFFRRTTIRR